MTGIAGCMIAILGFTPHAQAQVGKKKDDGSGKSGGFINKKTEGKTGYLGGAGSGPSSIDPTNPWGNRDPWNNRNPWGPSRPTFPGPGPRNPQWQPPLFPNNPWNDPWNNNPWNSNVWNNNNPWMNNWNNNPWNNNPWNNNPWNNWNSNVLNDPFNNPFNNPFQPNPFFQFPNNNPFAPNPGGPIIGGGFNPGIGGFDGLGGFR